MSHSSVCALFRLRSYIVRRAHTHPFHRKSNPDLSADVQHARLLKMGTTCAYVDSDSHGGLISTHGEESTEGGQTGRKKQRAVSVKYWSCENPMQ